MSSTRPDFLPQSVPFSDRILERQVGSCRLLILPVEVENVVSWLGSFTSNPVFEAGDELRQSLVISMLDKGTRRRDRFEIADVLENRGAELHFRDRGIRIGFSGRALKEDVADVMDVMAEQLTEPLFDREEFLKARLRIAASIRRSIERTGVRASRALRQQMFSPAHPNYSFEPEIELANLDEMTLDSLQAYHQGHFGSEAFTLVVAGDVDADEMEEIVARCLGHWSGNNAAPGYETAARIGAPSWLPLQMPDKTNIDVRMGHPLAVRQNEEVYTTLYIANFILGGNFSSRLMDIVRDEMGLTYGVNASLTGINRHYDGYWLVNITLSEDKLEEGLEATKNVLADFVAQGATADELADKKTTLTGTFKVQLATTNGLAATILRGLERGFGRDYLDRFPEWIEATTLEEINGAVKAHFDPGSLHTALAGSIPENITIQG